MYASLVIAAACNRYVMRKEKQTCSIALGKTSMHLQEPHAYAHRYSDDKQYDLVRRRLPLKCLISLMTPTAAQGDGCLTITNSNDTVKPDLLVMPVRFVYMTQVLYTYFGHCVCSQPRMHWVISTTTVFQHGQLSGVMLLLKYLQLMSFKNCARDNYQSYWVFPIERQTMRTKH